MMPVQRIVRLAKAQNITSIADFIGARYGRSQRLAMFVTVVAVLGVVLANFVPTVSCRVLVDGLALRGFPYPHTGIVKGDGRSLCIAMASIVAKVTRDRLMGELDGKFPGYGFAQHKGYGTEEHREAVLRLGRTSQHREMFLRKLLAGRVDPDQMDFLGDGE